MLDKGYAFKLKSSWSKAWVNPMLTSAKGFHIGSDVKYPYWVEIDFSGNRHLVYKMILRKRGDSRLLKRLISFVQI